MSIKNFEILLKDVQQTNSDKALQLYAITDSAQDVRIPTQLNRFIKTPLLTRCLLENGDTSALNNAAPHLVAMPAFELTTELCQVLISNAPLKPSSITVIASPLKFDALYKHLAAWTEVTMPDDSEMILAYWDSAILATLIGQKDDETLHVPGPVLTKPQAAALMAPITGLWYWDRAGNLHLADSQIKPQSSAGTIKAPIKLAQVQVDMLIEAGVPDSLVHHLRETQPALLREMSAYEQYTAVKAQLQAARRLGLRTMRDLIDYVCAGLLYKERMLTDAVITKLLEKVKARQLTFAAALEQFP